MNTILNRRHLLKTAMLSGAGIIGTQFSVMKKSSALTTPNLNQGIQQFSMAMSWPKASPGPALAAQYFVNQVEKISDGKLQIKLYGAGELVPGFEVFDAVASGGVDMAHTASFYWQGKIPASIFFTAIPFGLLPHEHRAWLNQGGGNSLWQEVYRPFGLIPMAAGNTGMNMAGWFKKPIKKLEDLKGLKIRMAGLGAEIYRALGAQPVNLPPSELVTALASGMVDGVEFLGPWIDSSFGFGKYAKYYYGPGFNKPNGTSELLISAKVFDALSPANQALIKAVAAATHDHALAEADWQNAQHLNKLSSDVKVDKYPEQIKIAAQKIAPEILKSALGNEINSLKIMESYQKALKITKKWSYTSIF